ncbi:MAG: response regulator [Candidatus Levybacteria bacterium]|nr:response regulator [Candidatus Levybacteria bacterium]
MNNKKKILVVEDERELRDFYVEFLSQNYFVMAASDGEEGLSLAFSDKYDVILLDLVMPKLDGIGFLEQMKGSTFRDVPVVVMSNLRQDEVIKKCFELGVKFFIQKADTTPDKVIAILEAAVAGAKKLVQNTH